ncbi:MAG: hypothetical protein HC818_02405 [Synechococcaceae cyanobacterium RM1_1_27]|nr:hypothetical protein [Synechococcaceae cyanobacterium SM2_3_2]NJO85648.1 hypothetical protein [Synechococcaceae cyanobacterium RM1_1_27]
MAPEKPKNTLSNFARKAFYLGVGLAGAAADNAVRLVGRAGGQLGELQKQLQDVVDELVQRGAMSADEARAFMDQNLKQGSPAQSGKTSGNGPVKINIDDISDETTGDPSAAIELSEAARLRQEIEALQQELDRIKKQQI